MLLENLSSLMESLISINQKTKPQEKSAVLFSTPNLHYEYLEQSLQGTANQHTYKQ